MEFFDGKVGAYEVGGTTIYIAGENIRFNELLNGACLFERTETSISIEPGQLVVATPKVAEMMQNDATRLFLAQVINDPAKSEQIVDKYLISKLSEAEAEGIITLVTAERHHNKAAIVYGDHWINIKGLLNPSNYFVIADTEDDARVMMNKRLAVLQP